MRSLIEFDAGVFYALELGHALVFDKQAAGEFEIENKFQLESMFDMWELKRNGVLVGFYFYSGFTVENGGGYIVTFMESRRGKAKASQLAIRHPSVMVFTYHGCGAIAISTKVNERMLAILLEQ